MAAKKDLIACINIATGEGFCRIKEFWLSLEVEIVSAEDMKVFVIPVRENKEEIAQPLKQAAMVAKDAPIPLPKPGEYPNVVKLGSWTKLEKKQLEYLVVQGVSDDEIAKMLGRTLQGVKRIKKSIIRKRVFGSGGRSKHGKVVSLLGG
ncbi:helix-turn-helix transcriptional regulator [Desulfotruncus alcoholivorax]|uniref:helix-turn-helix transcriptional regulator n=1 Tax=Desulfotruncus alcoholivorax TaxID=265477 RepID=UPI000408E254|nr:hypothetical protein [Desulfotruncus alcoholivorax]